jgi:hypothetical protein
VEEILNIKTEFRSKECMNDYDLTERKLKIGVALAIAIIGWLCLKGDAGGGQMASVNPSPLILRPAL